MIWPITMVVIKNRKRLIDPDFRQRYGTLYTPCETHNGVMPLLFITIFCVRRLLVAMVSAFLVQYPMLQILLTLLLSTLVLIWHLTVWPMESRVQNLLYFLNEYLYTACICCSLGFSNYNYAPETRFIMGWMYLGLLGLILVLNVTVMIIDITSKAIQFFRDRKAKKKVDEENKKRLEEQKNGGGIALDESDYQLAFGDSSSKKKSIMG